MSAPSANVLVVEDDPVLRRSLRKGLLEQGYTVQQAESIEGARLSVAGRFPDLILLDLGLPDGSGFDFLREVRRRAATLPILILTARDAVASKVEGLDLGADDYLVKPFNFQELLARIRARLRATTSGPQSVIKVADLSIDLLKRTVERGGSVIDCTPREFDMLVCLASPPGQAVSRQRLTSEVWKVRSRMTSMDNVIDVGVSRLREKVDGGRAVKLIHTLRGLGFVLEVRG